MQRTWDRSTFVSIVRGAAVLAVAGLIGLSSRSILAAPPDYEFAYNYLRVTVDQQSTNVVYVDVFSDRFEVTVRDNHNPNFASFESNQTFDFPSGWYAGMIINGGQQDDYIYVTTHGSATNLGLYVYVWADLRGGDDDFNTVGDVPVDVWGGGGNDVIAGGDSPDHIRGGSGADVLFGFGGDDFIHAGIDDDQDLIDGGDGADTIVYSQNVVSINSYRTTTKRSTSLSFPTKLSLPSKQLPKPPVDTNDVVISDSKDILQNIAN